MLTINPAALEVLLQGLRKHRDAPREGPGSLAFAYDTVPLTGILLRQFKDLQALDDLLRRGEPIPNPDWPWASTEEYRARLEEAKKATSTQEAPAA